MRNVNKTMKNKEFFKKAIDAKISADASDRVWEQAHKRLAKMYRDHQDLPKRVASHTDSFIFPTAAIYLSLKKECPKQAYDIVKDTMKERAVGMGKSLAKMTSIPGFKKFFLKMWDPMSHKMFGESAGFKNIFYTCEKGTFRMDITQCPYNKYLTELGCPELNILFCENDVYIYGSLPGLKFTRTKTIGAGNELCDFKMELEK